MKPTTPDDEKSEKLTEEQKREIREGYDAAMRGEVVDARTALEEIRIAHGFPRHGEEDGETPRSEREGSSELSEEMKRAILEGYGEALRGEFVDALTALEEIRAAHGF